MIVENILLISSLVFFLLTIITDLYCSMFFKRNESKYKELLSEYRRQNLDIDILTNYAVFFGSIANYQKIMLFVRLYKGKKIKFTKERNIQKEAYQFIQSLPAEKIQWILKLDGFFKIQFLVSFLWLLSTGLFFYIIKN
ncbi:hypothetical protein RJ498_003726 [Pluralibacter gergoviae]